MRAKDVMSEGITSLTYDATVQEAVELLVNTGVSAMPVLDKNGIMIGIVSEADLIRHARSEAWDRELRQEASIARSFARPVTEVMTEKVLTVDENMPLVEVAKLMSTQRVKRVPVTRDKSVIGVVSRVDLLKALLSRRPQAAVFPPKAEAPSLSTAELLHSAVTAAVTGHSWSVARRGDVVVNGNVAHLWGVVPSTEILEAYRLAAANVPGIKSVEVHMHVLSRG
ncbi:MAG: CBS domain-containing protein [Enhydrobacter sp.]